MRHVISCWAAGCRLGCEIRAWLDLEPLSRQMPPNMNTKIRTRPAASKQAPLWPHRPATHAAGPASKPEWAARQRRVLVFGCAARGNSHRSLIAATRPPVHHELGKTGSAEAERQVRWHVATATLGPVSATGSYARICPLTATQPAANVCQKPRLGPAWAGLLLFE
jgi:hypothetical protein